MAELILTQEEEESASYMSWDDASLGKAMKMIMVNTVGADQEFNKIAGTSVMLTLIGTMVDADMADRDIEVRGISFKGKELGDFLVHIHRLSDTKDEES